MSDEKRDDNELINAFNTVLNLTLISQKCKTTGLGMSNALMCALKTCVILQDNNNILVISGEANCESMKNVWIEFSSSIIS